MMWYSVREILPWCDVVPEVVGLARDVRRGGRVSFIGGSMASLTRWLADWHAPRIHGGGADLVRFGGMCDLAKHTSGERKEATGNESNSN